MVHNFFLRHSLECCQWWPKVILHQYWYRNILYKARSIKSYYSQSLKQQLMSLMYWTDMLLLSDTHSFCLSHQPMMDRNKAAELPKLQCGFIDFVCTFVYKVMFHIDCAKSLICMFLGGGPWSFLLFIVQFCTRQVWKNTFNFFLFTLFVSDHFLFRSSLASTHKSSPCWMASSITGWSGMLKKKSMKLNSKL